MNVYFKQNFRKNSKLFLYQSSGKKMNGKFMALLVRGLTYISLFQRKFQKYLIDNSLIDKEIFLINLSTSQSIVL